MQLAWGGYRHALNEAAVAVTKQPLHNAAGYQYGIRELWTVSGFLQAADTVSLVAALNLMELAYSVNQQTIRLLDDSGNVARFMAGLTPLGGTRVVAFDFDRDGADSAEFSTFRHYRIQVEGVYPVPVGSLDVLVSYVESLSFSGGGPRFVHLQPLAGLPVKQLVAESTPYRVVQRGEAVGLDNWPAAPSPVWPAAWKQDEGGLSQRTPERRGGALGIVYVNFPVTWEYVFEDALPLVGTPTPWV